MIYLVANTKGGVGKSTLATHLATFLAGMGRTLLIDTDKQGSAGSWSAWRSETGLKPSPQTVIMMGQMVATQGVALSKEYENTVIDAGGRDSEEMRYGMVIADRLIIPVSNSSFDTAAWSDMKEIIGPAKINNPKLDVCAVITRVHKARRSPRELEKFIAEEGVHVLESVIYERVAYVNVISEGATVLDPVNSDVNARIECRNFCEEVTNLNGE